MHLMIHYNKKYELNQSMFLHKLLQAPVNKLKCY